MDDGLHPGSDDDGTGVPDPERAGRILAAGAGAVGGRKPAGDGGGGAPGGAVPARGRADRDPPRRRPRVPLPGGPAGVGPVAGEAGRDPAGAAVRQRARGKLSSHAAAGVSEPGAVRGHCRSANDRPSVDVGL